jgi:hypothetical protein
MSTPAPAPIPPQNPETFKSIEEKLLAQIGDIVEVMIEKALPKIVEAASDAAESKKNSAAALLDLVKENSVKLLKGEYGTLSGLLDQKEKEILDKVKSAVESVIATIKDPSKWIEAAERIHQASGIINLFGEMLANKNITRKALVGYITIFITLASLITQLLNEYGVI